MRKITTTGVIILLVIVLLSGGLAGFTSILENLGGGIWTTLKWLASLATKFPDELGITDYIKTWILYLIITVVFSALGIYLTKRRSVKILQVCSFVVSAISLILTFSSI